MPSRRAAGLVVLLSLPTTASATLTNPSFDEGLVGWSTRISGFPGTTGLVSVAPGSIVLDEGDALLVTVEQTFTVPPSPGVLEVELQAAFDQTADFIPDAFEVRLVGANGEALITPFRPDRTAAFNLQEDGVRHLSGGASWDGRTARIPVSALVPGTSATVQLTLVGGDGDTRSAVQIERVVLRDGNAPPVADAGDDATLECGGEVVLDGSGSSDPDGDTLSYLWSLGGVTLATTAQHPWTVAFGASTWTLEVRDPLGGADTDEVTLDGVDTVAPAFADTRIEISSDDDCLGTMPDLAAFVDEACGLADFEQSIEVGTPLVLDGVIEVQVTATDRGGNTTTETLEILLVPGGSCPPGGPNDPPTADAGADQVAECGTITRLDGTASVDPEGGLLTWSWTDSAGLEVGTGPFLDLFVPWGSTVWTLEVSDPFGVSDQDDVLLTAVDTVAPVIDTTLVVNSDDQCEGAVPSMEVVVDEACLLADLQQDVPEGTPITFGTPVTVQVRATDAAGNRTTAAVTVTLVASGACVPGGPNNPPVADAGPDQFVECATDVVLDGSGSVDPDGDVLQYIWRQQGDPNPLATDAQVTLSAPPGQTTWVLQVRDPSGEVDGDEVVITAVDTTAPELQGLVEVASDASCAGVMPDLAIAASDTCASVSVTQDVPPGEPLTVGTPVSVEVTAEDEAGNTLTDTVIVVLVPASGCVPDAPPVAVAGADVRGECGVTATLDASASSDPDGDPLTYTWLLLGSVVGTDVQLDVVLPAGAYEYVLEVRDAAGHTATDSVIVAGADTLPPVIDGSTVVVETDAACQATAPDSSATAVTEQCALLASAQAPPAGTPLPLGDHEVWLSVADATGEVSSAVQVQVVPGAGCVPPDTADDIVDPGDTDLHTDDLETDLGEDTDNLDSDGLPPNGIGDKDDSAFYSGGCGCSSTRAAGWPLLLPVLLVLLRRRPWAALAALLLPTAASASAPVAAAFDVLYESAIEVPGDVDTFPFTVDPGTPVYLETVRSSNEGNIGWAIVDPCGRTVSSADNWRYDSGPVHLVGGEYELQVFNATGGVGTYGYILWRASNTDMGPLVATRQYDVVVPTPGSTLTWTYDAAPGERIFLDTLAVGDYWGIGYRVRDAVGRVLLSDTGRADEYGPVSLIGGRYEIELYAVEDGHGSISFRLWPVTDEQATTPWATLFEGDIAMPGQQDHWTVQSPTTGWVAADVLHGANYWGTHFTIYDRYGQRVHESDYMRDRTPFRLRQDQWRVSVDGYDDERGDYGIAMYTVVDMTDAVALGGLESATPQTIGQRVLYDFDLTADTRFWFLPGIHAPYHDVEWYVLDEQGRRRVGDDYFRWSGPHQLPAGSYTLVLDPRESWVGEFDFTLVDHADITPVQLNIGDSTFASLDEPGQVYVIRFTAATNMLLDLNVVAPLPNGNTWGWEISDTLGRRVHSGSLAYNLNDLRLMRGSYEMVIHSNSPDTGTFALTLVDSGNPPANPAPTQSVVPGETCASTIFNGQAQWCAITLAADSDLFLHARRTQPSLYWRLIDEAGIDVFNRRQAAYDWQVGEGPYRLKAGTYTLELDATSGAFPYEIDVTVPPALAESSIVLDQVVTADFNIIGERNAYDLVLDSAARVYMDVLIGQDGCLWSMYDPKGYPIFERDGMRFDYYDDQGPFDLTAGTYRVVLDPDSAKVPTCGFRAVRVLDQSVAYTIGDQYCGDYPTPGATVALNFEATEGQRVYLDMLQYADDSHWSLIDPAGHRYFDYWSAQSDYYDDGGRWYLAAGSWTVLMDAGYDSQHEFCLRVQPIDPPHEFSFALDEEVHRQIAAPGQDDIGTFVVSETTRVFFDILDRTDDLEWTLTDQAGADVFTNRWFGSDFYDDIDTLELTPGTYKLRFAGRGGLVPRYDFALRTVRDQERHIQLDDIVADSISGKGARYTYTFDVAQCTEVQLDLREGGDYVTWRLQNQEEETVVYDDWIEDIGQDDAGPWTLQPGRYTLTMDLRYEPVDDWIVRVNQHDSTARELYFGVDRFGIHQLRMVEVRYRAGTLDVGLYRELGSDEPVHGITWAPDGDLLVGEYDELWKADKRAGVEQRQSHPTRDYYVALDPSGTKFWLTRGWQDTTIGEASITPFGAVTEHALFGDDLSLHHLAFDDRGRAFYTYDDNVGILDMSTFTTRRFLTREAAAWNLVWDPFSRSMLLIGDSQVAQLDPDTLQITSRRTFAGATFDGAATDGAGLLYLMSTDGELWALDYKATRVVGDPRNLVARAKLDNYGSDIAPLSWIGSPCSGGPVLSEVTPPSGSRVPVGEPLVVSGLASASDPTRRVLAVYINGQTADALDVAGRFFHAVDLAVGDNTLSVEAWDRCGVTLQTIELVGYEGDDPASDVLNSADDITASLDADWSVTSWATHRKELLADVTVRNTSDMPLPGPIHVATGPELYPTVAIVGAAGQSPEGRPWVQVLAAGETLDPDESTPAVTVRFGNADQVPVRFTPRFYAQTNRAPRFTSTPPLLADTRSSWTYAPALVDDDGDAVTVTLTRGPTGMQSDGTTLSWSPQAADIGVHDVLIEAVDARGARSSQRFSLTVVEEIVNRAPVITSAPLTAIPRFTAYTYRATAVDADNDTLSWALAAAPAGAMVDPTGTVTWPSPTAGDSTFTLRVSDQAGGEAWQTWVLSVGATAPTNAGVPQITSVPGATAVVGLLWQYQPVAFDSDGDPLLWSLANGPDGMLVDPTTGRVTWTPDGDDVAEHLISLVAIDGRGGVARQSWRLNVLASAPDLPPTILTVPSSVALVGVEYAYQARASDPELQPVTWSVLEGPAVIDGNGRLTWTPSSSGDTRFRIEARDPGGQAGVQAFIVRARGNNAGPVIEAPMPQPVVAAGSDWMVDLDATDGDGDLLTWSLVSGPEGVGVGAPDGRVRWTPDSDDQGIHTILVRVTDPFGLYDEVEVLLQVVLDAVPPTPIIAASLNPACTGDPVRVCIGAVDNVGVERTELRVDGVAVTPDGAGCVTEIRLDPSTVVFDLDAWDPSGNTAHQVLFVDWESCGGTPLGG